MRIEPAAGLPDILVIDTVPHEDERGFLMEIYRRDVFARAGLDLEFVQENLSRSRGNVVRGLHFQHPHGQGKLIRAARGEVFDVGVDVRIGSATYGRWFGTRLSEAGRRTLYLPPGFAHGFAVLSESAELIYKCTDYHHSGSEHVLAWNDPAVGIDWPVDRPVLSDRDLAGGTLAELAAAGRLPIHAS